MSRPIPRRASRAHLLRLLPLVALLGLVVSPVPASSDSDARAVEIAHRTLEAMGGAEAWDAVRFLRFDFFGFRAHHWDRETGRHRLEGKTREGQSYVVLHDLDRRAGRAWLDGEELEGEALGEWLERAHGAWVNDTYWLLMPYKLLDPGVHLSYEGEMTLDGETYDTVKLTFDRVGLTPGDTYWAYFDRRTGLMDRWAYHLESWEADREPTHWLWLDWETYGGVKLSSTRRNLEDGSERGLGPIAVFDSLPESVFTSPEPVQ